MAREVANVQTSLWGNPEWKGLGVVEQWLYLHLMSHPTLSYAGVADWLPKRFAASSAGLTAEQVVAAAVKLQEARFVYISEATDEILIRSFLRHDGLLKQPRLSVSMVNAFAAIASLDIQKIVVNELQKLSREFPQWKAFESEKVQVILKYEGADMSEFTQDFTPDFTPELTLGFTPNVDQGLGLHTSTATSTATSPKGDCKEESNFDTWKPTAKHYEYGKEIGVYVNDEIGKFMEYNRRKRPDLKNINLAFTNWLKKKAPKGHPSTISDAEAADRLRNPWKYT